MEDLKEKILYLRDVMKMSFRQIGQQMSISRKSVSRIYQGNWAGKNNSKPIPLLDKYRPLISNWFKQYPNLKASQVYGWLRERGVSVSYPTVTLYTKPFRQKKEKMYHPLNFLPGEEGQVDWSFVNHPILGKLACFVLVLSYSRYLFAHIFPKTQFEFFIQGHLMAFSEFKGIPHSLRYDNLKSVVLKLRPQIEYNPRFLEFCRHYGIDISLCNPGAGNEKGRVERVIRTIKENFFNISTHSSIEALNMSLSQWVDDKNNTIHRATGQRPIDLFKEEKLRPLPGIPYENVIIHPPVKTSKTAMMTFDTNTYSVPEYLVGKSLSIHATTTKVMIYDGNKRVAFHPRSYKRNTQIINPLHRSYSRMSNKAKMQRIYEVIKNLHPDVGKFLEKNEHCGEDPLKTAYEIFKLLRRESRALLIGVAKECIRIKSSRLKTFLSYLHIEPSEDIETIYPQNIELLNIDYHARGLEVYENDESRES